MNNFLVGLGVFVSCGVMFIGGRQPLYESSDSVKLSSEFAVRFLGQAPKIDLQPIEDTLRTVDNRWQSSEFADPIHQPLNKLLGCSGSNCDRR